MGIKILISCLKIILSFQQLVHKGSLLASLAFSLIENSKKMFIPNKPMKLKAKKLSLLLYSVPYHKSAQLYQSQIFYFLLLTFYF